MKSSIIFEESMFGKNTMYVFPTHCSIFIQPSLYYTEPNTPFASYSLCPIALYPRYVDAISAYCVLRVITFKQSAVANENAAANMAAVSFCLIQCSA